MCGLPVLLFGILSRSLDIRQAFFFFLLFAIGCNAPQRASVSEQQIELVRRVLGNEYFEAYVDRVEQEQQLREWELRLRDKLQKMGIDCPQVESQGITSVKIGEGDAWGRLVL